jgi:PII-like signaling protein
MISTVRRAASGFGAQDDIDGSRIESLEIALQMVTVIPGCT